MEGLLVIAGIRGAVAVCEVLLDLALIVAGGLRRGRREVVTAGRGSRGSVERKAAEGSSRRRCGRRSIERKRAERRLVCRFFLFERKAEIGRLRRAAAGRGSNGRRRL